MVDVMVGLRVLVWAALLAAGKAVRMVWSAWMWVDERVAC